MSRWATAIILIFFAASCFAQGGHPPGQHKSRGPAPAGPPGLPISPQPQNGVVLWPMGARVTEYLELGGGDLAQKLKAAPELSGVKEIIIAEYIIPGPPAPPSKILEFYVQTLPAPSWKAFFQRGATAESASIAFKSKTGYVSVLARPNGATVTYIKGEIDLSAMPLLERVVREAIAGRGGDPIEVKVGVDAALALSAAGRLSEAVQQLKALIAAHPNAATAHFALAKLLAEQRNLDEAGRQFRTAIGLAPMNVSYRAEYAQFLIAKGDLENAQHELEQAATMDPWSAPIQLSLARLLEMRGMYQAAETVYSRLIQLTGGSPEIYTSLGGVLEREGKIKEALTAYQNALKLKSDFVPAVEAVKRLQEQQSNQSE